MHRFQRVKFTLHHQSTKVSGARPEEVVLDCAIIVFLESSLDTCGPCPPGSAPGGVGHFGDDTSIWKICVERKRERERDNYSEY